MKRHIFAILSALSLLLCVATAVLWVRSHIVVETMAWTPHEWEYSMFTGRGEIVFMRWERFARGYHDGQHWLYLRYPAAPFPNGGYYGCRAYASHGFVVRWGSEWVQPPRSGQAVVVPFWLLSLLLSLLPFRALHSQWRRRRIRLAGHCTKCSYDLRASNDRCPECGTAISAQTPSAAGKV